MSMMSPIRDLHSHVRFLNAHLAIHAQGNRDRTPLTSLTSPPWTNVGVNGRGVRKGPSRSAETAGDQSGYRRWYRVVAGAPRASWSRS